jgi:urease accessory protein
MLGSRALFLVPGAFMIAMISGALVAAFGYQLPLVEAGIIASVFALGALVVLDVKLPSLIASVLAATFAFMHGAAHGVEMTAGMSILPHVLGLAVMTLLLMASGALGAFGIARFAGSLAPRVLGIGALTAGVALLAAH